VWQKCLGGSASDFGSSIKQTSDGGYIVAGGTNSTDGNVTGNHGPQDAWVVKLDKSGDVVWQKCLGGSASESGSSIEQTSDGGYIVAGYSSSNDGNVTGNHGSQDAWVVKLDQSGDVVWQKCLGGSSIDYGSSIKQTPEGGYIVAGYSGSNDGNVTGNHGSRDSWVVKLDENGNVVWQKCLGGSSIDYGRSIERTSEGGYIVAGYSGSNDGNVTGNHGKDDYWIVKLAFQAPVADFSAIPTSGSAPLNVSFTDNSKDNPAFWLWNFGDGANSVEQNPVHTYSTAGNYTVNLTVNNENGTDSKLATITVSEKYVPVIPVANFNSNVTEGYAPLSVQFNDTSENATSVNWDFNNDGISDSLELNPVHEYADPENYTVNLTVSNENGTDSKLATITVSEKYVPVIPVANFSSNVTSGYAPLSVQFTDLSKNATEWNWDFGDNTPISIEQSPEHIFSAVGTYTVTLVATNGDGSSDEKSMDITVNRVPTPPVAGFTASTTKGTSPLTVKFTDASANNPTRWEWNFGDNTPISIEQSPEHTYATTGTFTANLTTSNADGIDATSKTITVTTTTGFPKARFKAVPFFGRAPLAVKFTDTSVNAASLKWNFGDGTVSTTANPIHTYRTGGFYTAKLTATNGDKSSTASKVIYVVGRQNQFRSPPRIPDTGTSESENPKCL
jgi:PKD repeat protein